MTNSLDGTLSRIDARRAILIDTIPGRSGAERRRRGPGRRLADRRGRRDARPRRSEPHARPRRRRSAAGPRAWPSPTARSGSPCRPPAPPTAAARWRCCRLTTSTTSIRRATTAWRGLVPMVYDGLVGFKRVGGAEGNTLVPDLASVASHADRQRHDVHLPVARGHQVLRRPRAEGICRPLPRSSGCSGRTRRGPTTTRASSAAPRAASDQQRCDLSKGIVTDDATGIVTIRLRAPDPDFLYKLALPFASIVPTGTPATGEDTDTRHRPVPDRGIQPEPARPARPQSATSRSGRRRLSRKASRTRS